MAPRKAKDAVPIAPAPAAVDHEDLMRKRDSFVTSMAMLRNAADEASRAGLAYFDIVTHGVSAGGINGDNFASFVRAMSAPPGRAQTEEPEAGGDNKRKRKRNVKPKDPNAPKKPATPFFLFCSEGRATVKSDMGHGVEFKDVQQELRRRWEVLPQEEKQAWSDLYQVKLAEWKKVNEAYLSHKTDIDAADAADAADVAGASTDGLPVPVQAETTATGGFTAVNHSKLSHETVDDSDEEIEEVPEVEEEPEVEEPVEEEVAEVSRMQDESSDSSLTPPPAEPEKPKAAPRGRKPRSTPIKVAAEILPSEKKPRKSRTKKVKDAEPAADESPKKRGRKKRKSGLE